MTLITKTEQALRDAMLEAKEKGYELEEKYAEKATFSIRTSEDSSTQYYTNKGRKIVEKFEKSALEPCRFAIRTSEDSSTQYYINNGNKIRIPEMNNSTVYFADVKLSKGQKCRVTLSTGQEIIIEG